MMAVLPNILRSVFYALGFAALVMVSLGEDPNAEESDAFMRPTNPPAVSSPFSMP